MGLADLTPEQLEQLAHDAFSSNKPLNLGPFILGSVVDALLCGILLMQCGQYISLSARDGWLIKVTIAYVIAMSLWSTALAWAWVWELFVRNFGTYGTFLTIKYISWTFVINGTTISAVQVFFTLRAWKILDRNRLFGVTSLALMLVTAGSGLAMKITFRYHPYTVYGGTLQIPVYTGLCSMVIADVLITTTILWYIFCWRGVSQRTDHVLSKLARVTFSSQLPPTLIAIATLAVYTVQPSSAILVPFIWIQPKMYGISLLHTLNMRPEMAQPTVVFGTTYTAPSGALGPARTAQTEPSDVISHNNADGIFRSRPYISTQHEPPKPAVISFDLGGVTTTLGDVLKVNVVPEVSYSGSSNTDIEMVERNSKLPDLESHTTSHNYH